MRIVSLIRTEPNARLDTTEEGESTMRNVGYGSAALAACVALTGVAQAQSTKGAGKTSASIIKFPVVNINQKAAGSVASKPSASVVGKAPTGGATTSVKLAKDLGDPLKPGY